MMFLLLIFLSHSWRDACISIARSKLDGLAPPQRVERYLGRRNGMSNLRVHTSSATNALPQGLGKTLQTIAFLAYLKHNLGVAGPHLIVVPKSTLQNWHREFEKWTPDVNVVVLTGTREERAEIIANRLIPQDFGVCVTSYEICLIEKSAFKKFSFEYIVIDEAHRIKNVDSILS